MSPPAAAPSPAPPPAAAARPAAQNRPRPEAPIFSFGPPIAADESSEIRCDTCQAVNPAGYRFCITCGATLSSSAQDAPASAESPRHAGGALTPGQQIQESRKPDDVIVGAPVVEIAAAKAAPAKIIICARCHGQSVSGTRFCKYCGAILEDPQARAASDEARAEPTAPAPSAVPRKLGRPALETTPEFKGATPAPPPAAKTSSDETRSPAAEAPKAAGPREQAAGPAKSPPSGNPRPGDEMNTAALPPRLVSITEDGSEGRSYPLSQSQVDIGRIEGDIVLADDLYVSPRHGRLILEDGSAGEGRAGGARWILRDLNSTNHIYLRIRNPYPLQDGDLLLLGLEVLQFQIVNDSEKGLGHAIQHGTLLFGSPATPRRARLCQKTVEGIIRDVYHLYKDETVIGRETADIVFSADPFLSRRHAVLRRNASTGEFSINDLDSSNGTYVAVRGDTALANGDFFRIGQHLFRLDLA